MTLFFLLLINLLSTYFVCSFFKNLSIFFVVYFALIVLKSEILSIFSSFNETNILILSIVELLFLLIFFILKKKHFYFPNIKEELLKIKNAFKLDKTLLVLGVLFCFMICCFLVLAFVVPPLEPDCRSYHFVRIFHYIKQNNFLHFLSCETRNNIMPINSEIIYSYFYLFKKSDLGFGFLSYFSFLTSIFQIYLILKTLKISIRKRLFTIFSLSSMGAILVQIPSCQTDIVISALSLTSIQLLFKKDRTSLFLSSLSYALAIGTKTTALLLFPAFLLLLFYILKNKKIILYYLIFLVFNFLIFSSYNYILNFVQFGDFVSDEVLKMEHKITGGIKEYIFNFVSIFCDFLGYRTGVGFVFVDSLKKGIFGILNIGNYQLLYKNDGFYDDRIVGFTHLGLAYIVSVFVSIYTFFKTKNKTHKLIGVFSFIFLLNYVVICSSIVYFPYSVRFFVSCVLFSGFCLIYLYQNKFSKWFVVIFCALNLILYPLISTRCPLSFLLGTKIFNNPNLKKQIMLNIQPVKQLKTQYEIYEYFVNNIKKQDKVAIIDDAEFYEIIQLINFGYDIEIINLEDVEKTEKIKKYDYIFSNDLSQYTNNLLLNNFKNTNKNFDCYKLTKNNTQIAKYCIMKVDLFSEMGFGVVKKYEISNRKIYIFKKAKI